MKRGRSHWTTIVVSLSVRAISSATIFKSVHVPTEFAMARQKDGGQGRAVLMKYVCEIIVRVSSLSLSLYRSDATTVASLVDTLLLFLPFDDIDPGVLMLRNEFTSQRLSILFIQELREGLTWDRCSWLPFAIIRLESLNFTSSSLIEIHSGSTSFDLVQLLFSYLF